MGENERDPQADLALCEAATPGPWTAECGSLVNWQGGTFTMEFIPNRGEKPQYDADLNFMAMAREALPYWIRRWQQVSMELEGVYAGIDQHGIEQAQRQIKELRAEVERLRVENERLRKQSEESPTARLRAWQDSGDCKRCYELDADYLLLCHNANGEWSCPVQVEATDSLAEMVDAALKRWKELYPDQ